MMRQNMIKIAFGIGVGILLVTAAPGAGRQKPKPDPALKEIREVLYHQVQAWNRRDLEGFMRGYWHSPDLTFYSAGAIVSGWDQTLARYRARYQSAGKQMGHLEFADMKIELLGPSVAFVRGRFYLTKPSVESTAEESSGLFTLTFRKFADGWKIIHDHTSTAA